MNELLTLRETEKLLGLRHRALNRKSLRQALGVSVVRFTQRRVRVARGDLEALIAARREPVSEPNAVN